MLITSLVILIESKIYEFRWKFDTMKPIFSSPAVCPLGVAIGCVDSKIYMVDHLQGTLVRDCLFAVKLVSVKNFKNN